MSLPTITLHQPYASLLVAGVKTIETRTGPPAGDMRPAGVHPEPGFAINRGDRIGIHAGKDWAPGWRRGYRHEDPLLATLRAAGVDAYEHPDARHVVVDRHSAPLGALVGTARVVDAVPILGEDGKRPDGVHSAIWEYEHEGDLPHQQGGLWLIGILPDAPKRIEDQRPYGIWTPGRWAWLLDDVQATRPPIPAKGKQGVWRWEP